MIKKFRFLLIAALAALPLASAQDLTGAGASFPFPLYSTMFDAYNQETGIQVNYQSIGSGGGQRQLLEQTIDRKSTRLNSSHVAISYAVFCLKKKKKEKTIRPTN